MFYEGKNALIMFLKPLRSTLFVCNITKTVTVSKRTPSVRSGRSRGEEGQSVDLWIGFYSIGKIVS